MDVGPETEIAPSLPSLASPRHPPRWSSDCSPDLQVGEVTTLVGFETRHIEIAVSVPGTISAASLSLELILGSVTLHACLF